MVKDAYDAESFVPPLARVLLFVGRSGSGKDTLADEMCNALPTLHKIVRTTTRPIRPGESQGNPYKFVSKDSFMLMDAVGAFDMESVRYRGWWYGSGTQDLTFDDIDVGCYDLKAALQVARCKSICRLAVVYLSESDDVIRKRLRDRCGGKLSFEARRRMLADRFDYRDADGKLLRACGAENVLVMPQGLGLKSKVRSVCEFCGKIFG